MTDVWGRMATYPKLGDSQLSHQEERPHGETPHSMWAHVPSPNCPYPWSSGARNLGGEIRGRRGLWPFWAKRPKFTQKVVPPNIVSPYRKRKEPRAFAWMQTEPLLPFATRVEVQSTMKAFLTPQSLKHTICGKKCIYRRYWHEHILGTLRSKNMSTHFWSRPIVGAFKHAHYG